jgi:transposase
MTQWAQAPQKREQMVLFAERLDEVLPSDHSVRLLDLILQRIPWTKWEARYHGRLGQPPIHPRVLASVVLYGLLNRIRSSRALENSLSIRLDFLWLVEGRSIDHTTLSEFRRQHADELKDLFVQVGLVARELGLLSLQLLAFDGTRLRANNRRSGTRTPAELLEMRTALAAKYAELEAKAAAEDARDEEAFGAGAAPVLPKELANVKRLQEQVEAALAELERMRQAGETVPKRLPLTDPESRLTPNKEGGFAPNYTPLATVDVESGLIVSVDVIAMTNEEPHLVPAIQDVQQQFGLESPPPEMLGDGALCSGANLAALAEIGVTLYSPLASVDPAMNPAIRADATQPVPPEQWDRLPTKAVTVAGQKGKQLDKAAFVYDEARNCYWCPLGQALPYSHTTREGRGKDARVRDRYLADERACAACPLRARCLQGKAKGRQINREQHEALRVEHARRMATPEAKQMYKRRRHPGERPFAMIKQHFGARRFLLRGLERVRIEWRWLATAFNLHRLLSLIKGRAGPGVALACSFPRPLIL